MSKKAIEKVETLGDVEIITYTDGSQRFRSIDSPKPQPLPDNRSWFQKLCDWWNDSPVTPYVKVRNLSDPFGDNGYEGGTAKGIETGIKIKF